MPLKYMEDHGFKGMIRDVPSWLLDTGYLYDSQNMIFDRPGVARQRGPTTKLLTGSQTASPNAIGFSYFNDMFAGINMVLYGCASASGDVVAINQTNGSFTVVAVGNNPNFDTGRPVRHFGYCIFPQGMNRNARIMAYQQVASLFSGGSTPFTITAGNNVITLAGADTTTNMRTGAIIQALDPAGNLTLYSGRVVGIANSTTFTVAPTPTRTMAIGALNSFIVSAADQFLISNNIATNFLLTGYGGNCGASFQNRLLWGGVIDNQQSAVAGGTSNAFDRRITYSPLPTEDVSYSSAAGFTMVGTGHNFLYQGTWPALNYLEVPGSDPIVGMEPINDNQLLVLTSTHPVVVSGNLVTQLATTNPTITFDITEVLGNASCISDLSICHTAKGIVWAGYGGIYLWNGREPIDLTDRKINTFYRSLALGANFSIHGAGYVRGHYILCGFSAGANWCLCLNLTSGEWTRLLNFDIHNVAAAPNNPASVFALRWWNRFAGAPSMTNGQTIKAETMFDAFVGGSTKTDADGSNVDFTLTTRVLTGDPETQKIMSRGTVRSQSYMLGANIGIIAQTKIDAADFVAPASRTLGSLSNTNALPLSAATNATPINCTTSQAHGYQSDDFVDIDGLTGNTHANGRWRIRVTSTTSFDLLGSSGNGAFAGAQASVKKLTESDYQMTALNQGQGVNFVIASGIGLQVNNFELHGLRVAYYEREPVMSA